MLLRRSLSLYRVFDATPPIPVTVGIRREDPQRIWERRAPLTPKAVKELVEDGVKVEIEHCNRRVFRDEEYIAVRAGATLTAGLSNAHIVLGIKEPPLAQVLTDPVPAPSGSPAAHLNLKVPRTHLMFSHTAKGQPYNTPLLAKFVSRHEADDLAPRLVDYELLTDETTGKRTVGFGWFAGVAGVLESLASTAQLHLENGIATPFLSTPRPHTHPSLQSIRTALKSISERITQDGVPPALGPFVVGLTGTGNVAQGCLSILNELPIHKVDVKDLHALVTNPATPLNKIYLVHALPNDYLTRLNGAPYSRETYYSNPQSYRSHFCETIAPYLTLLLNGTGWAPGFPRLMTTPQLLTALDLARTRGVPGSKWRFASVGDISCDIEGGLEFLTRSTTLSSPSYKIIPPPLPSSFPPSSEIQIMAIDILPASLPLDASIHFSQALSPYVRSLVESYRAGEDDQSTPPDARARARKQALRRATIARRGVLVGDHMWLISRLREFWDSERSQTKSQSQVQCDLSERGGGVVLGSESESESGKGMGMEMETNRDGVSSPPERLQDTSGSSLVDSAVAESVSESKSGSESGCGGRPSGLCTEPEPEPEPEPKQDTDMNNAKGESTTEGIITDFWDSIIAESKSKSQSQSQSDSELLFKETQTHSYTRPLDAFLTKDLGSDSNSYPKKAYYMKTKDSSSTSDGGSFWAAAQRPVPARTRTQTRTRKSRVLMFGSGMVARPAVEELMKREDVVLLVAGNTLAELEMLSKEFSGIVYRLIDVCDREVVGRLVQDSDVVISLLPVSFHVQIAQECIKYRKHLVTASYVSPQMQELNSNAMQNDVLLLNEVGLDPGIDHLSARDMINKIKDKGQIIKSFTSFCGGLPAPDVEHTPLRYKFSWNPRGVLTAGLNGAQYVLGDRSVQIDEGSLFKNVFPDVPITNEFKLEGLPNRDSISYMRPYVNYRVRTFMRGTLRYPGFSSLMESFRLLGFLNTTQKIHIPDWHSFLDLCIAQQLNIQNQNIRPPSISHIIPEENIQDLTSALEWLGLIPSSNPTITTTYTNPVPALPLPSTPMTPIDIFAYYLAHHLAYKPHERDMVVLSHEIIARNHATSDDTVYRSSLITYGTPRASAMARTVGIPVAIAALLVLDGEITLRGVVKPLNKSVYKPMLKRLERAGLGMKESQESLGLRRGSEPEERIGTVEDALLGQEVKYRPTMETGDLDLNRSIASDVMFRDERERVHWLKEMMAREHLLSEVKPVKESWAVEGSVRKKSPLSYSSRATKEIDSRDEEGKEQTVREKIEKEKEREKEKAVDISLLRQLQKNQLEKEKAWEKVMVSDGEQESDSDRWMQEDSQKEN